MINFPLGRVLNKKMMSFDASLSCPPSSSEEGGSSELELHPEMRTRSSARQMSKKERSLYDEEKEKNLKDKFSRLEGTISRIKSQGAGVAALAGGSGANPVQELG